LAPIKPKGRSEEGVIGEEKGTTVMGKRRFVREKERAWSVGKMARGIGGGVKEADHHSDGWSNY